MLTKIFNLFIVVLFTGCTTLKNSIAHNKTICQCTNTDNITLYLDDEYKCKCGATPITAPAVQTGCQTLITKIYYSKASGKITTCIGRLLLPNEKSRVIRRSE